MPEWVPPPPSPTEICLNQKYKMVHMCRFMYTSPPNLRYTCAFYMYILSLYLSPSLSLTLFLSWKISGIGQRPEYKINRTFTTHSQAILAVALRGIHVPSHNPTKASPPPRTNSHAMGLVGTSHTVEENQEEVREGKKEQHTTVALRVSERSQPSSCRGLTQK